MSIADAMATNGMKELGYKYINFDGEQQSIDLVDRSIEFMVVTTLVLIYFTTWASYRLLG